jgi:hypothetical protein
MRLLCVATSGRAREVNAERYPEFLDRAHQHIEDLKSLFVQFSDKLSGPPRRLSADLQRKLSWTYLDLKRGPHAPRDPGQLFRVMNDAFELSNQLLAGTEYYAPFFNEVTGIVSTSALGQTQGIDELVSARLRLQTRALQETSVTARAKARSVVSDADQIINVVYYILDSFIIKRLARAG